MADTTQGSATPRGRNIVIFSDGTGQRGGVFFDETRTNIYKLYRATRCAPDSDISPERQLTFYDPGLGTQPGDLGVLSRAWRSIYNYVSQATGLGITHNIIDCYTAIIQLWRPGDRVFLFGFSRGAYTVRCVASALCLCGIPTKDVDGNQLKLDEVSARKLATRAVKSVYQHVSSSRDSQFLEQRRALAAQFKEQHACSGEASAFPFFIGVFDTVAALSNLGSLVVLGVAYALLLAILSNALAFATTESAIYWASWLVFDAICLVAGAYVYTHLKFSFSLPGFRWWETVHLTTFRQKFYDQELNDRVGYARHAISIDERRADFKRVRWGTPGPAAAQLKMERFEQIWFAGNHADVGGGYSENESRLSDIALSWMLEAASIKLRDEGLLIDHSVLNLHPASDGMQHDETRSLVFRFAGKSDRDPVHDANLHPTVIDRFHLEKGVLQYDVVAPYRPEALRGHASFPGAYDNIPLPRQTCFQAINAAVKAWWASRHRRRRSTDGFFLKLKEASVDRIVSCIALLFLAAALAVGLAIFGYQILFWLMSGDWFPMPLASVLSGIRAIGSTWVGLQLLYDWLLALPLTVVCFFAGLLFFWAGGRLSSFLYRRAADAQFKLTTPAQVHT